MSKDLSNIASVHFTFHVNLSLFAWAILWIHKIANFGQEKVVCNKFYQWGREIMI